MFAYDCPAPIEPKEKADGEIYRCGEKDLEELVTFLDMFHKEVGIDQKDVQGYREDAESFIKSGNMYFWKDEQGMFLCSIRMQIMWRRMLVTRR